MSRIGKKPIAILKGVKVEVKDGKIVVSGPKGQLEEKLRGNITVKTEGDMVKVERGSDDKQTRALHGLYRALINNMVQGVTQGYSKKLEIVGVGYKAELKQNWLVMSLGYSHPIFSARPKESKLKLRNRRTSS